MKIKSLIDSITGEFRIGDRVRLLSKSQGGWGHGGDGELMEFVPMSEAQVNYRQCHYPDCKSILWLRIKFDLGTTKQSSGLYYQEHCMKL